jgi:hypothetical protein
MYKRGCLKSKKINTETPGHRENNIENQYSVSLCLCVQSSFLDSLSYLFELFFSDIMKRTVDRVAVSTFYSNAFILQ